MPLTVGELQFHARTTQYDGNLTKGCESIQPDSLLNWRSQIRSGDMIGPRILLGGPAASGTGWATSLPVRTPAEARRAVDSLRALGVDFVKVYEKVPVDAYQALLREAKKASLPVAGHVPVDAVTLVQAAELGQRSVEHVRDYLLMCFTRDGDEIRRFFEADSWSASDIEWGLLRHGECEAAVGAFRQHSTWLVPRNARASKVGETFTGRISMECFRVVSTPFR